MGKLEFIRPNTCEDISYRERQISEFSHRVKKILSDSELLVFHGTPIYNTPKIIQSGQIISGTDLSCVHNCYYEDSAFSTCHFFVDHSFL